MRRSSISLEVLVRGRPVREFYHTDGNVYIEGRKGSPFELRIRNDNYYRVLAVPSVDGLSVMDGKEASSQSNGYIVEGFSSVTIPGWRLNNDKIAEFYFEGRKGEGYAARSGKAGNEGVIGVMVYQEQPAYTYTSNTIYTTPWWHNWNSTAGDTWSASYGGTFTTSNSDGIDWTNASNTATYRSAGGTSSCFASDSLTSKGLCDSNFVQSSYEDPVSVGFGHEAYHHVNEVSFQKGFWIDTIVMYYDTKRGLEQRGIVVDNVKPNPHAFPGDKGCTPPPGWRRY